MPSKFCSEYENIWSLFFLKPTTFIMQWIIDPNKKLVLVINMPRVIVKRMALVDILLLNYEKKSSQVFLLLLLLRKWAPCSFSGHTGWWFLGEDSLTSCSWVPKWIRNFTGLITKIGHHKEFQSLLHCLLWCRAYAWNISFETL